MPLPSSSLFCRFALKSWAAQDSLLRTLVESLYEKWQADEMFHPWQNYIEDGQELLQGQQVSFRRPTMESDRLFMNIGGEDVIEMQHPAVPTDVPAHHGPGKPMIRLGAIASGKPLVREDQLRLEFAARHQCIGTDAEFDQVRTVLGSGVGSNLQVKIFDVSPPHEGAHGLFVTDLETIEVSPSVSSAVCTSTGEVGRGAVKVMGCSAVPCRLLGY